MDLQVYRMMGSQRFKSLLSQLILLSVFLAVALLVAHCGAATKPIPHNQEFQSYPNAAPLTRIAATPQPTPLPFVVSTETGIVPGRTTKAEVRALLGDPQDVFALSGRKAWWYLTSVSSPGLQAVVFSSENVYEVIINEAETSTAAQIVSDYGPPEALLVIYPPDIKEPPKPTPMEWMLYSSRGFRVGFWCADSPQDTCKSVRRGSPIIQKIYQIPMTVTAWLSQNSTQSGYEIRAWPGFVD